MATATDQNPSDAASSLGRSSSIDARDGALPRSDSQRRSASKVGRKGGRSGNDLFVCFAPRTTLNLVSANRPVVSPARDKGKEVIGSARRSGGRTLSSSIFSNKGAPKKPGFEAAEEPTSPKVTCIGQVRSKSKNDKKNKGSPGAPRKQAEGKKDSACSSFAKDFSCFGLPCDSYGSLPSFRGDKKSSGTVFAKSLVLIQREEKGNKAVDVEASTMHSRAQSSPEKERNNVDNLGMPGFKAEEHSEEVSIHAPASILAVQNNVEALQSNEIAEDQTSVEEDDTFEAEPPPSNALLLMRNKVEHLRILVPPPSINITLKRSTSAPAHCRRKSQDGDDGNQMHRLENARNIMSTTTEQIATTEATRETSSVCISSEDLPKPAANASKSFLQRCKSVSRSLSHVPNEPGEEAKSSPATQGTKSGHETSDMAVITEHKDEFQLVSEALSRRRSDSEALKVSLEIVPETWLWEARAVARQEPKEKTGSGRRLDMKPGGGAVTEWLDGELEAALWKSCHFAEGRPGSHVKKESLLANVPSPSLSHDTNVPSANQTLDAKVEAASWRCCNLVASHSSEDTQPRLESDEIGLPTSDISDLENSKMGSKTCQDSSAVKDGGTVDLRQGVACSTKFNKYTSKQHKSTAYSAENSSNLGRSSSVGSQNGTHLLEKGYSLRRCASAGSGQQPAATHEFEKTTMTKEPEGKPDNTQCLHEISADAQGHADSRDVANIHDRPSPIAARNICGAHDMDIAAVASSESSTSRCIVEAELWFANRSPMGFTEETECSSKGNLLSNHERNGTTERHTHRDKDDIVSAQPALSVLDRQAPPSSTSPTTPPEAVLYLRYDLGAFRISLDGTVKGETQAEQQQQKAMLEAISHLHIHDVQRTYTRLLKAASGKERASLSSAAFRLQRCKSEPVRLASY